MDDPPSLTKYQVLIYDIYKGVQQSQQLFCKKVDSVSLYQYMLMVLHTSGDTIYKPPSIAYPG